MSLSTNQSKVVKHFKDADQVRAFSGWKRSMIVSWYVQTGIPLSADEIKAAIDSACGELQAEATRH